MFPGVMFMVNHCGLPYERDTQTMKIWREGSRIMHTLQTSQYYIKPGGLLLHCKPRQK